MKLIHLIAPSCFPNWDSTASTLTEAELGAVVEVLYLDGKAFGGDLISMNGNKGSNRAGYVEKAALRPRDIVISTSAGMSRVHFVAGIVIADELPCMISSLDYIIRVRPDTIDPETLFVELAANWKPGFGTFDIQKYAAETEIHGHNNDEAHAAVDLLINAATLERQVLLKVAGMRGEAREIIAELKR